MLLYYVLQGGEHDGVLKCDLQEHILHSKTMPLNLLCLVLSGMAQLVVFSSPVHSKVAIRFPVRVHAWALGLIPGRGACLLMFCSLVAVSLSPSQFLSLYIKVD